MILRHRLILGTLRYHDNVISSNISQFPLSIKLKRNLSYPIIYNLNYISDMKYLKPNPMFYNNCHENWWKNLQFSSRKKNQTFSRQIFSRDHHCFPLKILRNCNSTYLQSFRQCQKHSDSRPTYAHSEVKKEDCLQNIHSKSVKDHKSKEVDTAGEIIERENIWTIPNFLCISRIVLSPYLCYCVLSSHYSFALGLFIFAGFTDLLDGMIARKFPSQASRIGSFLDPLADKILVSSLFLTLTYVGVIPFLLTGIIVYRDVVIIAGASYVRYQSIPPPLTLTRYFDATHATAQLAPTFFSKLNTAIQLSLITSSLAAPIFAFTDHDLLHALWFVTAVTTLSSGVGYIFSKDTYKILKDSKPV